MTFEGGRPRQASRFVGEVDRDEDGENPLLGDKL
jgi:hypothetical protein